MLSESGELQCSIQCSISLLTLTEIATPVQGKILKFKVQQECAGSGKAYEKHLQYQENLAWAPDLI